jgi:stage IV sporulation protein FB
MTWSLRLARILGTDVKVHFTFILLLAFLFAKAQMEDGVTAALTLTSMVVALFVCVLLHEFGHILMARHFGIRTRDVLLLPIGGVARLERIPEEPRQETLIALAGPTVTLGIIVALGAILQLTGNPPSFSPWDFDSPAAAKQLFYMNVLLLGFNLLPAFPMDGGRVLRAVLARRMNYVRATRIAATLGQLIALVGGLVGIYQRDWMWALIALFIVLAAGQEANQVEARAAQAMEPMA